METKQQQILQSAISTITRYGYRRTSMEDIAREAGISRPSIYQHFKNKENVVLAAIDLVVEQAFEAAECAQEKVDQPDDKLREYLCAYMLFYYRLIISGPHSEELLAIKKQFGDSKMQEARLRLVARVNEFLGLAENDKVGFVLATSAEGIKNFAPDEKSLNEHITLLVDRFL